MTQSGKKKKATLWSTVGALLLGLAIYAAQHYGWIESKPGAKEAPRARQSSSPSATRERHDAEAPDTATPGATTTATTPKDTAPKNSGRYDTPDRTDSGGAHAITRLQEQGKSGVSVTGQGVIIKVLPDDNEGSRHQRFLVKLSDGHVIKVSHNIDLAPRIPDARQGDTLKFHGDFEANDLGGAVHWTHRDPGGRHEHGWLELNGKRYQ